MTQKMDKVWYFKHRPQTIEGYIFQNSQHKADFTKYIADKQIPHMLLVGHHGTGKSTIANILIQSLDVDEDDILYINASQNNNVDFIRNEVKHFCEKMSMNGNVTKIIHMEEADRLTKDSQELLRAYMDDYIDDVRFMLSCNYKSRIIPPLQSRCRVYEFNGMDKLEMLERAAEILYSENIKTELDTLEEYVNVCHPDMRKLVDSLQNSSINGTLQPLSYVATASDFVFQLIDCIKKRDWQAGRAVICNNVSGDQWEGVYSLLYNHVADCFAGPSIDEAIIIIAEHLYKHAFVADPEVNATSMLIQLGRLK